MILCTTPVCSQSVDFENLTLSQLETRLSDSEARLEQLAPISLRNGVGNLGWESKAHRSPNQMEWVQIELTEECLLDEVVLVPVLWRNVLGTVEADGFPVEFKILVGREGDEVGVEAAKFVEADVLLPRVAPVVIPITPTIGSWIRVEATHLSRRALDRRFLFQLSEVMAFSGEENVALGCLAKVSSSGDNRVSRSTNAQALVDGFTPYLMSAANGSGSNSYVGFFRTGPEVTLTFDLGEPKRVNRIQLHGVKRRENVPQVHHADYAVPDHFVVEASNDADFSEAVELFEYQKESIYDSGPILMSRFEPYECQFIRLTAIEAYKAPEAKEYYRCIGFAEIEIFEDAQNVAAGITPTSNIQYVGAGREGRLKSLTDGQNDFGAILPFREWIEQLASRHDLKLEISQIQSLLAKRYSRQSRNLRWSLGLIAFLTILIASTLLINRWLRIRETDQLKKRFAADLHDEVGADLHAIALLSDLAKDELRDVEKLGSILDEIRSVSNEASTSVRHITTAEAAAPFIQLPILMQQAAERIVIGIEHKFETQGAEHIENLQPQTRAHLLLFFKECLVNVSRHAEATLLVSTLKVTPRNVQLTIEDNGHGIGETEEDWIPPSLLRRAKLLGAKIQATSGLDKGTKIELQFRRRQWKQLKKR